MWLWLQSNRKVQILCMSRFNEDSARFNSKQQAQQWRYKLCVTIDHSSSKGRSLLIGDCALRWDYLCQLIIRFERQNLLDEEVALTKKNGRLRRLSILIGIFPLTSIFIFDQRFTANSCVSLTTVAIFAYIALWDPLQRQSHSWLSLSCRISFVCRRNLHLWGCRRNRTSHIYLGSQVAHDLLC